MFWLLLVLGSPWIAALVVVRRAILLRDGRIAPAAADLARRRLWAS
jgi:hypothetical protein